MVLVGQPETDNEKHLGDGDRTMLGGQFMGFQRGSPGQELGFGLA